MLCVFLRGAADALNMIVPHGDEDYYQQRPTLAIPRPDDRRSPDRQRAIDLDGFFGLHPALIGPVARMAGRSPGRHPRHWFKRDESRSHFKAMELMERGVDQADRACFGLAGAASGYTGHRQPLARYGAFRLARWSPARYEGPVPTTALRSIADFHLGNDP